VGATFDGSALSRSNRNATGESTPQQCRGFTLRRPNSGADTRDAKPADFRKLIADETEKWAKVIKFAGIKAD